MSPEASRIHVAKLMSATKSTMLARWYICDALLKPLLQDLKDMARALRQLNQNRRP
jgi:hypothetical protein